MPARPARLHIANARIWTADPVRPWASGMVIEDGTIAGLDDQPALSRPCERIDADGRVIVPGLIDSHVHLLMAGRALSEVDLSHVTSRTEFEAAIAEADARLPQAQWLIGRGWNEVNWSGAATDAPAMPDRSWFARVNRPCVCHRMDIHAVVVNDAVLRLREFASMPDPVGGRIVRTDTGQPTGLFLEAAAWELINPLIPDSSTEQRTAHLLAAQRHAHAMGLTAVGSMEFLNDVRETFVPLRDRQTLRCAVTLLDRAIADEPIAIPDFSDVTSDDRLAIIGCKTFIDGTLGSRTARMLDAYADHPDERGMLVELAAHSRLHEWISAVAARGLSPSMHAIGDEAVRLALNAIESLPADVRARVRPRIEHAQHVHPADLHRFNGAIASMQPLHKADDARTMVARLGSERTQHAFAFRSLNEHGARLAFGSDWPVVSCDPMRGMRAAITGLTVDESPFHIEHNLTVEQALAAYTRDAAYCLQLDRNGGAGVLREGHLGDCVMLDIDPFTADWVRRPPRAIMTIVGGKVVFDAM